MRLFVLEKKDQLAQETDPFPLLFVLSLFYKGSLHMHSTKHQSEIARLMEQIMRENEAAEQGLTGLAHVASHESINARMQRGAEYILGLIEAGKHEEAQTLLYAESWCAEEP